MSLYDEEYLEEQRKKNYNTISYNDWVKNGNSAGPSDGKGGITYITDVPVPKAPSNDPKFNNDYWDRTNWETYTPKKTTTANTGNSGGSGGGSNNSGLMADYKANLGDLYNKVMGYGGYQAGAYTPTTYTPTTYTAGTYAPSVYSRTVDTSGTEALLNQSLNDIHNYGDFKYDLNADMLYQQAIDNYMMKGQQAAADTTAMASALTGGYGNSYAALVGNQAYQDHITQANNMIPQYQQMALNIWQSGYDRLLNDYNATSQQLANLLDIEDMNFNIWNANESNAANAFAMNEANRYNAWASNEQNAFNSWSQNEQNAFNAWQQNEQNRLNEWQLGYGQTMDQYELAKDYYATLEALQKASGGSGGGSTSGTSNKAAENTVYYRNAYGDAMKNMAANMAATPGNPYTQDQLYEALKQQNAYNNEQRYLEQKKNKDKK